MKKPLLIVCLLLLLAAQSAFAIPVVVAAVAGGIGAAMPAIIAGTAINMSLVWGMAILNGVLAGASMLLSKTSTSASSSITSRSVTNDNPTNPRVLIYGTAKVGGTVVFRHKTGGSGEFLHMIVVLAGHEVEEIGGFYLGTKKIILDTKGRAVAYNETIGQVVFATTIAAGATAATLSAAWTHASGTYRITFVDGETVNAVFTKDSPAASWDTALAEAVAASAEVSNIPANNVGSFYSDDVRSGRAYGTDGTTTTDNGMTDVIISNGGRTKTTRTFFLKVNKHLGNETSADADLVAAAPTVWNSTCVGFGVAYAYLCFRYSADYFSDGIDNISFLVKGRKVLDTRTGLTAFSSNPALCLRDYLCDAAYGLNVSPNDIDADSFNEAANICDEQVLKLDGSYENRFTCNGTATSDTNPEDVIAGIRSSFCGTLVLTGGSYLCLAGAWRTPEPVGISEADARDSITLQASLSKRDVFNSITGLYISSATDYQSTNYPVVRSQAYIAQDGGILSKDFPLQFTDSPSMAQCLAKIELLKIRLPMTLKFPATLAALRYQVGDVIPVSYARFGFADKLFEITNLDIVAGSNSSSDTPPTLGVDLTLRETASSVYDWSTEDETPMRLTAATNLPAANEVVAPANFTASSGTSELYLRGDGTVASRVRLSWEPAAWATVISGGGYYLYYKLSSADAWSPALMVDGASTQVYLSDVEDGQSYDFKIQSVSILGAKSPFVAITNYTVEGKSTPPAAPTSFNLVVQPDGTRSFSWLKPSDLDFAGCLIGYSTNINAVFSQMTLLNSGALASSPYETNQLAAGIYSFAIVAVDTSGNESAPVYIVGYVLPNPRIAGAIAILNYEQLGWAGTLTNCRKDNNGWLEATSATPWSSLVSWDSSPSWLAGANSPLTYISNVYDIGVVTQFTPLVTAQCLGTPTYQVKISQNGTTWSGWQTINSVYTARYIQVQIQITGASPLMQSAQTILSGNPKTETISNINTANIHSTIGVFRAPITKTYNVITSVNVMLLSVGAGWSAVVMDKNATAGPLINIYNGSNTLADCAVDIAITGL